MIMTGGFRQESAGHNFFTPGGVYTKCKGVYNKCCICAALCAANRTEKEQRRRMEQKRTAPRAQKTQPLTYREWKRRKQLRLARNWGLFLAGCALVVFLLTKGILWLLPHLHGADGPITDEELEDCRRGLLSGMNGVEDSLGGMETWYYIEVLRAGANSAAPIQTPAQARAALQAVTKEDVRSILRQLTLSVSYLLTKEEPTHA